MARCIEPEGVGIVLLASGQAKRMGQNKLLLPMGKTQEPCVRRLAKMLVELAPERVLVVFQDEAVKHALEDLPLRFVYNPRAALGQSEAIKLGISQQWNDSVQAFAFVMGDQPLLTGAVCKRLIEAFCNSSADIVVPCVGDTTYSPVIFHRKWMPELLTLTGDKGAKGLLKRPNAKVVKVIFESSEYFEDMDTPRDYQILQEKLASLENGG